MTKHLTRAIERLARWLFPASGQHRPAALGASPVSVRASSPRTAADRWSTPPYEDGGVLVRPYVLAHEAALRAKHTPRRALLICPFLGADPWGGERT